MTCQHHWSLSAREKGIDYWHSPKGVTQRIDQISQAFAFRMVNTATKIIAPTNGAEWLHWDIYDDDEKLCPVCRDRGRGGDNGFYRVQWFLPEMPAHPNCRCQWEIWFETPTWLR